MSRPATSRAAETVDRVSGTIAEMLRMETVGLLDRDWKVEL